MYTPLYVSRIAYSLYLNPDIYIQIYVDVFI